MNKKLPFYMHAHSIVAVYAYCLIIFGVFHFSHTDEVIRLLLPVVCGVPLLTMNNGVRYFNAPAVWISIIMSITSIGIILWSIVEGKGLTTLWYILFTILLLLGVGSFISLCILVLKKGKK